MIDYQIRVIQGFKVPRDKLFKKIKETSYLCEHKFDRKEMNFCPECGKESKKYEDIEYKNLLNIDFERMSDNDDIIGEGLILTTPMTNSEETEDYIIGVIHFQENPNTPENTIELIEQITKEEVLKRISKLDIQIPYDKNSFGVYVIFDIW